MRSTAILIILSLLGVSCIHAVQRSDSTSSVAEQITALERAWSNAVLTHDANAVSALLADDFIGIDGRGFVSDKAAELEEAKPPAPRKVNLVLIGESLSDVHVRAFGETAVLTAINTARFSSDEGESTIRYRRTTVWVRHDGSWQCVSFHGSRILESQKP